MGEEDTVGTPAEPLLRPRDLKLTKLIVGASFYSDLRKDLGNHGARRIQTQTRFQENSGAATGYCPFAAWLFIPDPKA